MTSLKFQPTFCAIKLCQFGQTRNASLATYLILLSSTAASSATSSYVVVPEHFDQNDEPACKTRNGLRKSLFCSKSEFNRCNSISKHVNTIFYEYFTVFYLILLHFSILSSYGKSFWSSVHVNTYCVGAGMSTLISISDGSDLYIFHRKTENTWSVKEEVDGEVFISPQSRHISFVFMMIKVLFPTLYIHLACKQFCFPPRKSYK